MSVANQRIIQIKWREERDTEHLYTSLNIDVTFQAMEDLKYSGFKMWFYINKNQKAFKIELSQAACAKVGIKKDSYYNGINELIEKGYLVPVREGSNIYNFYELPVSIAVERMASSKMTNSSETQNKNSNRSRPKVLDYSMVAMEDWEIQN